jgi:asparagine synthase (glutamine-hydrolysing)
MCGIAGIVGSKASLEGVSKMCALTKHRGPDFTGFFLDSPNIVLGHNRLSIIDLSDSANQPFHSADGRYVMVFNGEVYNYLELKPRLTNHLFKTNSDTEVLLAAYLDWGEACLHEFNGMFSFAIWDKVEKKLFAARDRFGVKPFYYGIQEDSLFFSSEIPPLFELGFPKKPNLSIWANFFVAGTYGTTEETFWSGIHKLPAGNCMTWSENKVQVKQWYNFKERVELAKSNRPQDITEYIKELLIDAIKLRFRADVPVGFNLSGGLDSSMLFALIKDQFRDNHQIEAFTFYTGDPRYDEHEYVKLLVKSGGYKLNLVKLNANEVPDLALSLSHKMMEPFGGVPTIAYSKLFQDARSKGFKVLLDGQGADEAWAGYDYHFNSSGFNVQGSKTSPCRPEVLKTEFLTSFVKAPLNLPFDDKLLNLQYADIFHTKLQRALRFSDAVSMNHSTELREPFIDYRVMETVFGLPENLKRKDGVQKWLLREIANEFLENSLRLAPKRPLQTPQREWLSDNLKAWVMDQCQQLEKLDWFEKEKMNVELEKFMAGDNDNSFYIWQWVNTALIFNATHL